MRNLGLRKLLAALQIVAFGWALGSASATAQSVPRGTDPNVDPLTPRLELMLRAMRVARDWHIGRPAKPELIKGAIEGMLAKLDPEAELYSQQELRRILRSSQFGGAGIGLEFRREPSGAREERRGYRVVSVLDSSPAARAGIKAGDLITHVDGRPAGQITHLGMVHHALGGSQGSSVRLTVERAGEDAASDVDLVRSNEQAPSAAVELITPGIARIRLASVDVAAAASVERLIPIVDAGQGGRARGFVLDLRSTSAGTLDGVRAIADHFLDAGSLLRTRARTSQGRYEDATKGDILDGRPLVVLVDAGTAGPAEALAISLVDNKRARLAGTKTAGRGAMRSLVAVGTQGEKGAIRMTTERLLTPAGAPLDSKGLTPEVMIDQSPPSPRCRTLDIGVASVQGSCRPRKASEDGQLSGALGLILDDAVVAAKATTAVSKP